MKINSFISQQITLATFLGIIFLILSNISGQKIWDTPAIDVFPLHENYSNGKEDIRNLLLMGKKLFKTKFNKLDGTDRPNATGDSKPTQRIADVMGFTRVSGPDANSCLGCHNDPLPGGAGEFAVNVFVGAHFLDPPGHSISTELTSERNTPSLFGSGVVEQLAKEITNDLQEQMLQCIKEAKKINQPVTETLNSKGISFGTIIGRPNGTYDASKVKGIDQDLVIKPFGAKGVVISLREFTINALNQHHGIQSYERFGWEKTGINDFDNDGYKYEFTLGQVSALTLFQASLPPPIKNSISNVQELETVRKGEKLFSKIGCDNCHKSRLPLQMPFFTEPNEYNRPGNLIPNDGEGFIQLFYSFNDSNSAVYCDEESGVYYVDVYSDFKRHVICDEEDPYFCNERLKQDFVPIDQFMTSRLWNVGSSMPYGHRGDLTTLSEVILHHSGEAKKERNNFIALNDREKKAVIAFLKSLIDGEL